MAERTDSGGGPNGEVETISLIPKSKNQAKVTPIDNAEALASFDEEEEVSPRTKGKSTPKKRVKRKTKSKLKAKAKSKAKAKLKPKPKAKTKIKAKTKPKSLTRSNVPVADTSKVKVKMQRNLESKRKRRSEEVSTETAPTLKEQIQSKKTQSKRPLSLSNLRDMKEIAKDSPPVVRPEKGLAPVVNNSIVAPPTDTFIASENLLKAETPKEEAFLSKNENLRLRLPSTKVSKVVEISSVDEITKEKGIVKSYSVREGSLLFNSIVSNINRESKGGMDSVPLTANSKIHSIVGDAVSKWESLGEIYIKFPRYYRIEENENTNRPSIKATAYCVMYYPSLYISNRGAFHILLEVKIVPPLSQSKPESTNENKGKVTKVLLVNPSLLT